MISITFGQEARMWLSIPRWLWLTSAALAFSLVHIIIDFNIGLFGATSKTMSLAAGLHILALGLIYAWWALTLGRAALGQTGGLAGLFGVTFLWSFLGNGLITIFAAPPPSAAFPFQDIAHFGNLLIGGWASYELWRAIQAAPPPAQWRWAFVALGLSVLVYICESLLFIP
jgi:hypothetical protein